MWQMLANTEDPRDHALLATAMNTGLRAGEVARLRVGDVDIGALSLRVWVSKSRVEDVMPMTSDLLSGGRPRDSLCQVRHKAGLGPS